MAFLQLILEAKYISIRKSTLAYLFSAFLLKIVLDLSSYYVLAEKYAPFTIRANLNLGKLFESYILLALIVLIVPKKQRRISTLIVWIFLILSYIPELTVYGLSDGARIWIYAITAFWLFIFSFLWIKTKRLKIVPLKDAGLILIVLISIIIAYTILVVFSVEGLTPKINFVEIYENRDTFSTVSLPLASYVIRWTALVVNPFLLILSLIRRNYLMTAAVCLFQLFLFAWLGQKIFLFSIPFVLALDWIARNKKLSFSSFSMGLAALISISSLSFILFEERWLSAIVTNRLLVIPAVISFDHYDFFSQQIPLYLGHSLFRSFINYPYDLLPWFVIGGVYFGDSSVSANAGMIPDAYMNFHFFGILFLALLLVFTLSLIDQFTKVYGYRIVLALVIMPMFTSLATGFQTVILTTGLGLSLLILYILPVSIVPQEQKQDRMERY
jgi:hypothetical protein